MTTEGRGKEYGVIHLVVDQGARSSAPLTLLHYLERYAMLPVEPPVDAHLLLKIGAIYVNEKRAEENIILKADDYVRVHTRPRRYKKPDKLIARILKNTPDYLIVDKPSGIPVHSQVDNSQENLLSFLEEDLAQPLFVTHRLDIETTGCLLIARSPEARRSINQLFRDRLIKKYYVAMVESFIEPRLYTHYMKPSFKSPREVSLHDHDGWAKCELRVLSCVKTKVAERDGFEVQIELLTGRPQQIRAQLSALGAPIAGDIKYGSAVELSEPSSILLRCSELIFDDTLLKRSSTHSAHEAAD